MSTLAVEDLTVAYLNGRGSGRVVVDAVSFELTAGRILGFAGESGCGKSTTALAAIGYPHPGARIQQGRSMLGESDLLQLPLGELRRIWGRRVAYVSQEAALAFNPSLTIGRQMAQPLRRLGSDGGRPLHERQVELLELVGLPDPEDALRRYPHQFSGGQQQRIAIAVALAGDPEVLILDEPTAGLDVTAQARISTMLRELVTRLEVATLYVSHDLSLLANLADRLAVMYAGQIVEQGPARDVVAAPAHPYTRALLQAVPTVRDEHLPIGLPGAPPPGSVRHRCAFAARCEYRVPDCLAGAIALRRVGDDHDARCIRVGDVLTTPPVAGRALARRAERAAALLAVDDLWCEYDSRSGAVAALKGVSMELSPAETLGIVGESGSGKSTLLRAIAGLHVPVRGEVRFRGEPLAPRAAQRPRGLRRELQLVFQNPASSLNPRHSVRQIVGRPLRLFRDDVPTEHEGDAVERVLEAVKLPATFLDRYPSDLSGGQRQRVALARAFAPQPSVLLCDEVTSALDVSVQATILELIADLARDFGTAIVFVSHDLGVVRAIAERVVVLRHGELCEEADSDRIFTSPQHPYTRELLRAIPELPGAELRGARTR